MNKIISSNSTSNLSRRTYFEIVDRLRSTNSQVQYFETLTVENGNNKNDNIIILSQIIKYSPNTFILYKIGGNYDDNYIIAECSGKAALDIYDQGFDNVTKKKNQLNYWSKDDQKFYIIPVDEKPIVYNNNNKKEQLYYTFSIRSPLTIHDYEKSSYMIYLVTRIQLQLTLSQPRNINEVIDSDILSSRINTTCITRMKLE
ncbi:hypothetical protein U3516DRAFT_734732 [Neocallimastix sp. 'constans']